VVDVESTVKVSSDQVSVNLKDEAVILATKSGTYFGLDEVGQRIWKLLQSAVRVSEILATLIDEYEVEPDLLERDLLTFLGDLESEGLLYVENRP
jgi:hypothetical protein